MTSPTAAVPPHPEVVSLRGQLRRDLPLLTLLPCALLALALGVWLALSQERALDAQFNAEGQALARQLAELSAFTLRVAGPSGLDAIAAAALHGERARRIEINHGGGMLTSAGAPLNLIANLRVFTAPIQTPSAGSSQVLLYRDAIALEQARRSAWLGAALITLVTLALAAWALRRRMRPLARALGRISQAVAALESGHLQARCAIAAAPPGKPAAHELAALAAQIDRLAERMQLDYAAHEERLQEVRAVAMQRMVEAEQAAQSRARFLAAASHDLRQPLHAMGLFIDSLRVSAAPAQQTSVRRLQESAEFMGLLLNDMLDISRLDAQVLTPTVRPILLAPLFMQLATQHAASARQAGVRLLLWRGGHQAVLSDATLLLRVIGNLVDNAIRHTASGGVVLVAVRRGHRSDGSAALRIEVRDNGTGIAMQHHRRIFEEFYQVSKSSCQRGQSRGFGLGLAICSRIATLLGTRIALRSAPGRGSVFSLVQPLAQQADAVVHAPQTLTVPGVRLALLGLRCLVVDDDENILVATRQRLVQWGCETECVRSAAAALARMRAQGACFNVVLCDMQLAGPDDGMTVIAAAQRWQPQALVVIVSGATSPEALQRLRQEDVLVLIKPVAPAKLRAALASRHTPEVARNDNAARQDA